MVDYNLSNFLMYIKYGRKPDTLYPVFVLILSMSNFCLEFVLNYVESMLNLTALSKERPSFVLLQGNQVAYFSKNLIQNLSQL